jgi:hypothetical protein
VRLLQQRGSGGCGCRKNDIGLQRDKFLGGPFQRFDVGRPTSVDLDITALRPPELLEFLPKCRNAGLNLRVALAERHQYADAAHALALLRTRGDRTKKRRRHRRAAEKGDEPRAGSWAQPQAGDRTLPHR